MLVVEGTAGGCVSCFLSREKDSYDPQGCRDITVLSNYRAVRTHDGREPATRCLEAFHENQSIDIKMFRIMGICGKQYICSLLLFL